MNRIIAEQLYKYAHTHYNEDGWDFVVECLTVEDIIEDLLRENITSLEQAINYYHNIYVVVDDVRQQIKETEF